MADEITKKISIDVEVNTDGQQQISNYKIAFDNLRTTIAGLSNPLANLSDNISSFDKDVTKLTASIDKLNTKNQDLNNVGDKVKGKISDIITSFSSWKGIVEAFKISIAGLTIELSAGLSLIIAFLPEIVSWVGELFKGNTTVTALNKTLRDNKIVMDAVNQAMAQGRNNAQQELVHLKLLYSASQDHNLSLKERKKIAAELQSKYPAYFANMSTDAILTGQAAVKYNELTKAIIATARAKAAEDLIAKNQVRQLGNEDKLEKLNNDLTDYNRQLSEAQKKYDDYMKNPAGGNGSNAKAYNLYRDLTELRNKATEVKQAISHLNTDSGLLGKQNEKLAGAVTSDVEKNGAKILTTAGQQSNQLVKQNKLALEKLRLQYEQANKDNRGNSDAGDQPERDAPIDPGKTAGVTIDDTLMSASAEVKSAQLIANKTNEIKKSALQKFEEYVKQSDEKIASTAFGILSNSIKQQSEAKIAGLEKDKALELSNKSLTSAQRLAIEQKYKKQEGQVKAKAFKEEQEASIAQAVINGALAITKAEAQTGTLGTFVIPGIIAETAAQIAKIATQKPPAYAKGGLHYTSDGRGGVLPGYSRTDNTNAYLRSGEGIVVSEAMRAPWARNLVSAINVGFGGRDFSITNPGRGYAVGGIFTDGGDANRYYNQPVNDQKNLANTIAYQMINNFPPVYVDVKDVNNQQNILAQTINK